jgi:UDP-N-acetylmuramate: L-alanyl-gamma-D-glutamyl-meso-diaminopimelate ligase
MDALAAIALAYGRGVECDAIARALETFQSVRRRMEIKGEAGGVLVVEDFAHHPTAIGLTLEAARTRWPGRRIWAAIEPRSNTMRRKIFQNALPESLLLADAVLFGPVNRAQLLADEDRLSPDAIAERIRARGRNAKAFASAAEIADYLSLNAASGDLVLIMSNGSFDGLTPKLLEKLHARAGVRA